MSAPRYKKQGHEIVGFAWFQGWSDQHHDRCLSEEMNMDDFGRDLRQDRQAPGYGGPRHRHRGPSKDLDKSRRFGNDSLYPDDGSSWLFTRAGTAFGKGILRSLK